MRNLKQLIFIILFISNAALGQKATVGELIPFHSGDKWGYSDEKKNIKIPIKFDHADRFEGGYAKITIDGKLGVIDKSGKYIIKPIINQYDYLIFSEGLSPVKDTLSKLYGYINQQGNWIIKPQFYSCGHFKNGFAPVRISNGKECFFIDKKGNHLSKPQKFATGSNFHTDYIINATEYYGRKPNEEIKYGLTNKFGKEIVPLMYQRINIISSNFIEVENDSKVGFIDSTGKEITPIIYDKKSGDYSIEGLMVIHKDKKCGVIDSTGKIIIPLEYSDLRLMGEGKIAVIDSSDKELNIYISSIINIKREIVIPQMKISGMLIDFKNGFYRMMEFPLELMKKENSFFYSISFINNKGQKINSDIYIAAGNFNEGLAMVVNQKNKVGFIDTTGKTVIKFQYDYDYANGSRQLLGFNKGLCLVSKNGICFYIDKNGNEYYELTNSPTTKKNTNLISPTNQKNTKQSEKCDETIYSITEEEPTYKNGFNDLKKYFTENIDITNENKTGEYKIPFEFIIDCDGKPLKPYFSSTTYSDINNKLESAILKMEQWQPATLRSKRVKYKVKYIFIIKNGTVDIKENSKY